MVSFHTLLFSPQYALIPAILFLWVSFDFAQKLPTDDTTVTTRELPLRQFSTTRAASDTGAFTAHSSTMVDTTIIDTFIRPFSDSLTTLVAIDTIAVKQEEKDIDSLASPEDLFTGVLPEQDLLARRYVRQTYAFEWKQAERTFKKLSRFERRKKLLPLSGLLAVSSRTIRVQGGEYRREDERKELLEEIGILRRKTLRQVKTSELPDSLMPLALFISGGIKGLVATLKIETAIVEAAIEGYDALGKLEEVTERVPDHGDPYLGIGIFYCLLAKSPGIVRAALNLTGRKVTFKKGLGFLRRSALQGRYTNETAMLYLIRFLSPYWGHLQKEKTAIFGDLEHRYPENPYYTFLRLDETICFHPEVLSQIATEQITEQRAVWDRENFSLRRYAELVTLQLRFINDTAGAVTFAANEKMHLREFDFYPLFLDALSEYREKKESETSHRHRSFSKAESAVLRALGLSDMTTTRRNYYEWHIRDALKIHRSFFHSNQE